ncbi:MAG: hypothetical protein AAF997_06265 [Myxococcota bacterium]
MSTSVETSILRLIESMMGGAVTLDEFQSKFEFLFLDAEPYPDFSDRGQELFSAILEKVSLVSDTVTGEERVHGWTTTAEFVAWLKEQKSKYDSE